MAVGSFIGEKVCDVCDTSDVAAHNTSVMEMDEVFKSSSYVSFFINYMAKTQGIDVQPIDRNKFISIMKD